MRPVPREIWSRPWTWMWVGIVVVLAVSAFFWSFYAWSIQAAVMFGVPEIWAITHPHTVTPPLTSVLSRHVPRPYFFLGCFALYGAMMGFWFHVTKWYGLGPGSGIGAWIFDHFTQTYDRAERLRRERNQ